MAQDAAANDNTAATQAVTIYDATAPSVDIQGAPAIVNSTAAFAVSFEFSEAVIGFAAGDVSLANASLSNFQTVDAITYTADVTPDGNCDVTIDVAAAVAQDPAGNDNTAATQAVTVYDAIAPSVDIQGEPSIVNSTANFAVTFQFNEDVTGFAASDVSLANATLSNFQVVDADTYTAEVTPDGNGDVTIDVTAAVAQDAAANDNLAAPQASTIFDATAPDVDIVGEPAIVNSATPFGITIEFSEAVTGFDSGDISVGNAALSNFVAVDSNTYTVDITPDAGGDISIDVVAGVAQDAAGNDNTAAPQATVAYDATAPGVDIQGEPGIVSSADPFSVSFQFTENVTGFDISDISLSNASASNFVALDAATYTADITPDGSGDVTIDVAAAVAQDAAGNDNTAAAQASISYDAIAPSVDIQGEPANVNSLAAFPVTFEFSEDVTGFDASDVSLSNATLGNFSAVDGNIYTADITPDGNGDITIEVAASVAQDAAGNDNTAATQASVVYDATAPSVDIQGEPVNVNSLAAFSVSFEFSEDVSGFDALDISVANASVSNFVATDANTYSADITPDGNGDISIDVAAAVAQDIAEMTTLRQRREISPTMRPHRA